MQDKLPTQVEKSNEPDLISVNWQYIHHTTSSPTVCITVMAVLHSSCVLDPLNPCEQIFASISSVGVDIRLMWPSSIASHMKQSWMSKCSVLLQNMG